MTGNENARQVVRHSIRIRAPRAQVAATLIDAAAYREWTKPFGEGSFFEGTWEEGTRMRFLTPTGDGVVAEIAAHRPAEFLSIRHLGEIHGGIEDTSSEAVRAWAPIYENYSFVEREGESEVVVEVESLPEHADSLEKVYAEAFEILKRLCEGEGRDREAGVDS